MGTLRPTVQFEVGSSQLEAGRRAVIKGMHFGVEREILEDVREELGRVGIRVRLRHRDRGRCGICGPGYDRGAGIRR